MVNKAKSSLAEIQGTKLAPSGGAVKYDYESRKE